MYIYYIYILYYVYVYMYGRTGIRASRQTWAISWALLADMGHTLARAYHCQGHAHYYTDDGLAHCVAHQAVGISQGVGTKINFPRICALQRHELLDRELLPVTRGEDVRARGADASDDAIAAIGTATQTLVQVQAPSALQHVRGRGELLQVIALTGTRDNGCVDAHAQGELAISWRALEVLALHLAPLLQVLAPRLFDLRCFDPCGMRLPPDALHLLGAVDFALPTRLFVHLAF